MLNFPIKLVNGQSYDWNYFSFANNTAVPAVPINLTGYSIKLIATDPKGVDWEWNLAKGDFILMPPDTSLFPTKFRTNLSVQKVALYPFAKAYFYIFVITPGGSSIPFATGPITKKSI